MPVLDADKLQDLFEIRLTVEGLATRRAATRMTTPELDVVNSANEAVLAAARPRDVSAEARANEQFHFCNYRAAHSTELLRIIEHLWLQMGPYLLWILRNGRWPGRWADSSRLRPHKEILDALQQRNGPRAEAALRADLRGAAERLMKQARQLPKSASE